jgi:DNA-binding NarL/FixJ family response regulator
VIFKADWPGGTAAALQVGMCRKLQVLLVDEEGLLRDGLCVMINLEEGFAVAGVIPAAAIHTVSTPTDPDLSVVDFGAPAPGGLETVAAARSRWPNVPILVLTFQRDDAAIESAVRQAESDGLSDREREVMRLIAQGFRTREIAEKLSVSHKTVEKHRTNLMRKLGLRTAAAVAAYAITNGYVRL